MAQRWMAVVGFCLAAPLAAAEMGSKSPGDIHFIGEDGLLQRGNRCAAPMLDAALAAEVNEAIAPLVESFLAQPLAPEADKLVDVAFHVVTNGSTGAVSDARIADQIAVLNAAYQGKGFQFRLVRTTRTSNRSWFTGCYGGGEMKMKNALAYDVPNTLNIYSCSPRNGILGYSYLPATFPEADKHHGVVVLHSSLPGGSAVPYNLGDTATHEVGHYLGLDHTFANGCSAPGDSVADTPYEASAAFGCPGGRDTCSSAGLDPIENFMDYTDDACMDRFSSGQAARMQAQVATYKPSL